MREDLTCFKRTRPKPKLPPVSVRMRNKPMSMMTSNIMSAERTAKVESLEASLAKLRISQEFDSVDHEARTYSCQVNRTDPKQSELRKFTRTTAVVSTGLQNMLTTLVDTYHRWRTQCLSSIWQLRVPKLSSPCSKWQFCRASLSALALEDDCNAWKTYTRSTINSVEETRAR